jgi:hypothetical protein
MKPSPILGIAICAAVALTCLVAPVSASATVLCPKKENPCSAPYEPEEKITGALTTGQNSVFENELGNVTCTKSPFTGVLKSKGGEMISPGWRISSFLQESCKRANGGAGEDCTLTALNLGAAEIEQWLANFQSDSPWTGNGTAGLLWNTLGAPGYNVVCGVKINCKFTGTSATLFKVTGAMAATLVVAEPMNVEGAVCPKNKPTWRGNWTLSAPSPLFLSLK